MKEGLKNILQKIKENCKKNIEYLILSVVDIFVLILALKNGGCKMIKGILTLINSIPHLKWISGIIIFLGINVFLIIQINSGKKKAEKKSAGNLSAVPLGREGEQQQLKAHNGPYYIWGKVRERMDDDSAENENFMTFLFETYEKSLDKHEYNKNKYFKSQTRKSRYDAIKEIFETIYSQKTVIISVLGLSGVGIVDIIKKPAEKNIIYGIIIILVIFLLLGFVGLVFLQARKYQDEIKVREYGETWIRHEAYIFKIQKIMIEFMSNLGAYADENDEEKKRELFMERIMIAMKENEDTFQKNMEDIK